MILEKFPLLMRPPTIISKTVIHTESEFLNLVNELNGKKNIFVNLYHFTKTECCSSFYYLNSTTQKYVCNKCRKEIEGFDLKSYIIDSVVFDLDPSPITYVNKVKQWIKARAMFYHFSEYERYIVKTGKGFHFYIRTIPLREKDFEFGAKNAIKNFQIQTEKIFGATDWITHGDTSQAVRVPGTWNKRSGFFCTTLSQKHLKLKYNELDKIAEKQPVMTMKPIGKGKKLDLREYDEEVPEEDFIHEGELAINIDPSANKIENIQKILKSYHINYDNLSLCIKIMMNNEFLDYRQRFLLINTMKNFGLSEIDCEKLIGIVLWSTPDPKNRDERKTWDWAGHVINEERQVYYTYDKDYGIPSCKSGRNLGFEILGLCAKCESKDIMRFR